MAKQLNTGLPLLAPLSSAQHSSSARLHRLSQHLLVKIAFPSTVQAPQPLHEYPLPSPSPLFRQQAWLGVVHPKPSNAFPSSTHSSLVTFGEQVPSTQSRSVPVQVPSGQQESKGLTPHGGSQLPLWHVPPSPQGVSSGKSSQVLQLVPSQPKSPEHLSLQQGLSAVVADTAQHLSDSVSHSSPSTLVSSHSRAQQGSSTSLAWEGSQHLNSLGVLHFNGSGHTPPSIGQHISSTPAEQPTHVLSFSHVSPLLGAHLPLQQLSPSVSASSTRQHTFVSSRSHSRPVPHSPLQQGNSGTVGGSQPPGLHFP
mmetsp:Transcript_11203/g.25123  ORF Transcript_11203/g.25123 Transcript_11203/m.25123 type:complete len:310 (-) Transcript_11203:597-1526(-)